MRKVKIYCDHCNKLIKGDIQPFYLETNRLLREDIDLCESCSREFERMMQLFIGEIKEGEEK